MAPPLDTPPPGVWPVDPSVQGFMASVSANIESRKKFLRLGLCSQTAIFFYAQTQLIQ